MKRKIAFVLAAVLMLGLTACGAANETDSTNNSSVQTETSQSAESSTQDSQDNEDNTTEGVDNAENEGKGKVLIAYFAYSENMGDTSGMSADAITFASVGPTDNTEGNLQVMAQVI